MVCIPRVQSPIEEKKKFFTLSHLGDVTFYWCQKVEHFLYIFFKEWHLDEPFPKVRHLDKNL